MDKKQLIANLRAAKSAHIKWRSYAQALVAGLPVSENQVPVIHTDCVFGRWYYGQGQQLSALPGYQAIEIPHEALHGIYMQIFKLLFEMEDTGFFAKLVGSTRKNDERRRDQINTLLNNLVEMSKTLLTAIELLEQEIMRMEDEDIATLV